MPKRPAKPKPPAETTAPITAPEDANGGATDAAPEVQAKRGKGAPKGNKYAVGHGAPKGNTNAGKHMRYSQKKVRDLRDRHKRAAEKEALAILKAGGLQNNPLAKLLARNLARLEAMASRMEAYYEHRGMFQRSGEVKPGVKELIHLEDKILGEARKLLDELTSIGKVEQTHHIKITRVTEPEPAAKKAGKPAKATATADSTPNAGAMGPPRAEPTLQERLAKEEQRREAAAQAAAKTTAVRVSPVRSPIIEDWLTCRDIDD